MEKLIDLANKWRREAQERRKFIHDRGMWACINVLNQCADELEALILQPQVPAANSGPICIICGRPVRDCGGCDNTRK